MFSKMTIKKYSSWYTMFKASNTLFQGALPRSYMYKSTSFKDWMHLVGTSHKQYHKLLNPEVAIKPLLHIPFCSFKRRNPRPPSAHIINQGIDVAIDDFSSHKSMIKVVKNLLKEWRLLTNHLKYHKSTDPMIKQSQERILSFCTNENFINELFSDETGLSRELQDANIEGAHQLFYDMIIDTIGLIMINETYLYRRKQSVIKESQMNILDGIMIKIIKNIPEVDATKVVNRVVKIMQLRLRLYKYSERTNQIVEWYFENVFGKFVTDSEIMRLSIYELSQLLLNISLIDYDLTKIEENLIGLKVASLHRIKTDSDSMSTKELCQIISTIYRMNLIFLK